MNQVTQYQYSSVQINLPNPLANQVIGWGEDNIVDDVIYSDPHEPTYGREDEIHVTVLYGLHTERAELLYPLLLDEPQFRIRLGPVSIFKSNNKFDVVKIEVIGESLYHLNEKLSYNLASTILYQQYSPHITIAYVTRNSCDHLKGCMAFDGAMHGVNTLHFCQRNRIKVPISLATRTRKLNLTPPDY